MHKSTWSILVIGMAIITIWPMLDNYSLAADLIGQATLQVALFIFTCAIVTLCCKQWRLSMCFLGISLVNLGYVLFASYFPNTFYVSKAAPATQDIPELQVLTYNVWKNNSDQAQVTSIIQAVKPDVIWLQEVHKHNVQAIMSDLPGYSVSPALDKLAPQGSVLITPHLINHINLWPSKSPFIQHIKVVKNDHTFDFVGVHLNSPKSQQALNIRNKQLALLESYLIGEVNTHSSTTPVIVAGDFNSVFWRPSMISFSKRTTLRNTSILSNLYTSWPSKLPSVLRIAIDRLYHSSNLCVEQVKSLDFYGSDHRPVIAQYSQCNLQMNAVSN